MSDSHLTISLIRSAIYISRVTVTHRLNSHPQESPPLLNWAARYYPILRVLKQHNLFDQGSLVDLGSGLTGVLRYRRCPLLAAISPPPRSCLAMTQLVASAAELPIEDKSFDAVLSLDMLEHVPPELRPRVISEALLVARKLVIFGFPCGDLAQESDNALSDYYLRSGEQVPACLEEHWLANFPDPALFANLPG